MSEKYEYFQDSDYDSYSKADLQRFETNPATAWIDEEWDKYYSRKFIEKYEWKLREVFGEMDGEEDLLDISI